MWQDIIAGVLVIAAAVYAARTLGPRSWRRKSGGAKAKAAGPGECGCGKDDGGCH
jgi:hypothetical protein